MLEAYDAILKDVRTINQLNRLHISFGNTITPLEVAELSTKLFVARHHVPPPLDAEAQLTLEEVAKEARSWLATSVADLKSVRKTYLEPFYRRDIRKGVLFFSNRSPTPKKNFLVTLAGANERLMMPIATFLQNLNASTTDVLYLADPSRAAYRNGIPRLAEPLQDIAGPLSEIVDLSKYERRVAIGVSAGGTPAIVAALALHMDAVLGCGAGHPDKYTGPSTGGRSMPELLTELRSASPNTRVIAAFGDDEAKDRAAAEAIAKAVPGALELEVTFDGKRVQHNILYPLSQNGSLPGFLNRLLGI